MRDKEELKRVLEEQERLVYDLYKTGGIPLSKYYKVLLCYAYEYMDMGDMVSCERLIWRCSDTYFEKDFQQQMLEDSEFRDLMNSMAQIIDRRIVDIEEKLRPEEGEVLYEYEKGYRKDGN